MVSTLVHDTNITRKMFKPGNKYGALTMLQMAMGLSSLNVRLTYLRGVEVAELKEEDISNLDYSL